ncbi:MAG: molybdopterin-dependent oxidoreductase [Coriobacteriales bacterium]|jgi:anaerobic selenocysteine-containing dehydrogenase|nr:molybdopterin-dependent oxidoreductase [Coriobacteriales bacterium]
MKIFEGQGTKDLGKPWQYEEDGLTVTRGCAWSPPGCHPVGCGIKVYTNSEGELVKIEGDENHPITNGRLCVRCLTMKDYVYHPDRIRYPMKRAREDRGKDKWERITWDEAYDLIAEKVAYYKENYGAESILIMGGTGREGGPMLPAYAHACLGTPNACYTQSGYSCYIPRVAGTTYVLGATYPEMDYAGGLHGRYDDPMFKNPELIVFWGKEPLPSNGDGLFGHAAIDMMRRGAKLMSVDPRVNWAATRADWHLRLRPGTDAALAMGMLNVIISEGLYDYDFVSKWTYGFDELSERVKDMPVEKAAEITGVDAELIREAARAYAAAKPAQIAWGLAIDQKSNGVQAGHCVLALQAITGNIDIPGGQLIGDVNDGLELGFGWNNLGPELQSKILGIKEYPAYVGLVLNAQCDMVLDALETGEPYAFKMGAFEDTNLLAGTCSAQPKRWHDAMAANLEWCFGIDVWITPTIQATCEVFLPLSTTVEHDTVVYTHYGASPIMAGAVNKCITVGETKGDCEILYELGKRCMPINFEPYKDYYDFLADYRLGKKQTFEQLRDEVVHQKIETLSYKKYETGNLRPDGKPGFNTPTGRVELYSTMFQHFGEDPLPYYEEPQLSPVSTPDLYEQYPLVLTTGARTYCYFHSEGKQIPYLREMNPDPLIEINPKDALKYGIVDGQWVEVENPFGRIVLKAKVSQIVKEGVVHAQHGFWFPEADSEEPVLFDVWRSNINELIPHKYIGKLGFGAPFKCILCKISPTDKSWDTDMAHIWDRFGKLVIE